MAPSRERGRGGAPRGTGMVSLSTASMIRSIVRTASIGCVAHRRLPRQHHRVGPVEDGVGDVGGLGAGRPRVRDHRLEHLGGHDDRLVALAGGLDGPLLHQRHLLERQLHAEVAARDHDAVERLDDRLEVLHRLGLLELGDDRDADVLLPHDVADQLGVVRRADERQRDEVRPPGAGRSGGPRSSLSRAPGRSRPRRAGTGPCCSRPPRPRRPGRTRRGPSTCDHRERELAVVDQQPVADADVVGEVLVGRRHPLGGARRRRRR